MVRFRQGPILLAEDDETTLTGLAEFLTELGYDVVAARNGQEAMDHLLDGVRPSLFVVDLAMPHLGGEELSKYLQSDPDLRQVPVVVVTGSVERMGRTAADAVLEKPSRGFCALSCSPMSASVCGSLVFHSGRPDLASRQATNLPWL